MKHHTMKKKIMTLVTAFMMAATIIGVPMADKVSAASTLVWPVPGHKTLSQGFHGGNAIDISDGKIAGANIHAAMGGKVTHIYLCTSQHYGSSHDCCGFGTGIVIKGDDGRIYQYAHMQAGSIPSNVYHGARVEAGQHIGKVGTTGNSSGNHLHFGIAIGNYWNASGINPANESYRDLYASAEPTVSWGSFKSSSTNTDAYVYAKMTSNVTGKFTQAGINVWDSKGKLVATKTEAANYTRADLEIWYNITNETGAVLTPGTTYTYQIWTKFNNKTYYCDKKTFKTTGTAPSASVTAPSVKKPAAPSKVTAKLYGYDDIQVSWSKVSGASGYYVQYRKSTDSSYSKKYTMSGTSCKINNLSDGYSYCVKVTPYVKSNGKIYEGSSKTSSYVYTLKKVSMKSVKKSGSKVNVSWYNISGESGYQISKSTSKSGTNIVSTYSTTSGTNKSISATKKKTYYYKVRAYVTVDGKKIYGPWSNTVKYVRK